MYSKLLETYQPKIIESNEEYKTNLRILEDLFSIESPSPEYKTLISLYVLLISSYEEDHFPIPESTPHDVLIHLMKSNNLKQKDLIGVLGSPGVISEIVNKKRGISKEQARRLANFFNVSVALFI